MRVEHPYERLIGGRWIKGNLHTHTTYSDGNCSRQQVIDAYAAGGYGFLAITDHDVLASADELGQLDGRGMALLPANEVTGDGVHMLHIGAATRVEPAADRQVVIDAANAEANSLLIVNHPNWFAQFDHCKHEQLCQWQGYAGIEIYNGVIEVLEGSPLATDHWDRLLSAGRRVWGFANDDAHKPAHMGNAWNVAYVTAQTPQAVMEALRGGRFYCSTGVTIAAITVDGTRIRLVSPDADRIIMYGQHQRRLAMCDGQMLEVGYPETHPYVRFECLGRGGRCAWTQPFFRAE
jgi:hypothetical protein